MNIPAWVPVALDYKKQTDDLTEWFMDHMIERKPFTLTYMQYIGGIDFLPKGSSMKVLVELARLVWKTQRHYTLSPYNQTDVAFFRAANQLQKIIITD